MESREKEGKIGMAMTQAFNDISHYQYDEMPVEIRQIKHNAEMKLMKYEIKDLK